MITPISKILHLGVSDQILFRKRNNEDISLGQFRCQVARLSGALSNGRVGVYAESIDQLALGIFAGWYAGAEVILLPALQSDLLRDYADRLEVLLVSGPKPKIEGISTLSLPELESSAHGEAVLAPLLPTNCPLSFFTSGSSAQPKMIEKNLSQLEAEIEVLESLWGKNLGPDCRVGATVAAHHIYGLLFRLLWPMASAREILVETGVGVAQALEWSDHAMVLVTTPAHLSRLDWPAAASPPHHLRAIFSSGAPLSQADSDQTLETLGLRPIEVFGSTETGGIGYRMADNPDKPWRFFPGVEGKVDSEDRLHIRSPWLDVREWLKTGDQVSSLHQDQFILVGRADGLIKIEGKRVSPTQVEAHLLRSNLVSKARVVVLKYQERAQLAAVVVPSTLGEEKRREIGNFRFGRKLRAELSRFEEAAALPRRWRFVAAIPSDDRGKQPLALLTALFHQDQDLPEEQSETISPDAVRVWFDVSADHRYFQGHFPNLPILPGVAQVHWATLYTRKYFGVTTPVTSIQRLKFVQPVAPETSVQYRLNYDSARARLDFVFESDKGTHALGTIIFGSAHV